MLCAMLCFGGTSKTPVDGQFHFVLEMYTSFHGGGYGKIEKLFDSVCAFIFGCLRHASQDNNRYIG